MLIYLSGGSTKVKSGNNNIESNSLSEPLVGGETVFYGARNALVAEVLSFVLGFCYLVLGGEGDVWDGTMTK